MSNATQLIGKHIVHIHVFPHPLLNLDAERRCRQREDQAGEPGRIDKDDVLGDLKWKGGDRELSRVEEGAIHGEHGEQLVRDLEQDVGGDVV